MRLSEALIPALAGPSGHRHSRPVNRSKQRGRIRVVKVLWPVLGQIGNREKRRQSIEMLVGPESLPGSGWTLIKETAWRSGFRGRDPRSLRARRTGEFVGHRVFRNQERHLYIWVEVVPYESIEDATEALPALQKSMVKYPGRRITQNHVVEGMDVPEADQTFCFELEGTMRHRAWSQKFVAARLDRIISITAGSGLDEGWNRNDLLPVASAQTEKVRRAVSSA